MKRVIVVLVFCLLAYVGYTATQTDRLKYACTGSYFTDGKERSGKIYFTYTKYRWVTLLYADTLGRIGMETDFDRFPTEAHFSKVEERREMSSIMMYEQKDQSIPTGFFSFVSNKLRVIISKPSKIVFEGHCKLGQS
jgi:hypothetical protein